MNIVLDEILRETSALLSQGKQWGDEIRLTNDEFLWLLDGLSRSFRANVRLSTATYAGMKVIVDDSVAGIPFADRIRQ